MILQISMNLQHGNAASVLGTMSPTPAVYIYVYIYMYIIADMPFGPRRLPRPSHMLTYIDLHTVHGAWLCGYNTLLI